MTIGVVIATTAALMKNDAKLNSEFAAVRCATVGALAGALVTCASA